MYTRAMKKLFIALLFVSIFPLSASADPLPLNQYDRNKKEIKAPVYTRFRPFYYPQQDPDGAYILAEATAYNEGTSYYIIDENLYMSFEDFFLYIPSTKTLPQLEILDFWVTGEEYRNFRKETLDKFRVHPTNATKFTLSCGPNKSVTFIPNTALYSKVTWVDNGKEYPLTLRECPISTDYMTDRSFAYCDDNILYYDGDEFFSDIPEDQQVSGIFFCDLKNRTRGTYAVKPLNDKERLWPYNPMGIPGTNWIIYAKESFDKRENALEQLVVRPKLTPKQADKAAKEYQQRLEKFQKEKQKK